jgi:branched-chain amino acid transport system permease protein
VSRGAGFRAVLLAATAGLVVLLPFVVSNYHTYQLAQVAIYAIAVIGVNLVTGYTGQISLGHGAFMLIGAYTTSSLIVHASFPYGVTIPIAGVIAGIAGFLFGFPALRLAGVYLALATLAIATALPGVAEHFSGLTGGSVGLRLAPPTPPFGWNVSDNVWIYVLSWSVIVVMFALSWLILRGRFGRALRAIRDRHAAAVSSGVNLALYKTLAFGVSAAFAGVSGSLLVLSLGYINPSVFPLILSILLLTGAVVGGLGTLPGPIFGGLLIVYLWATPFYANLKHVPKDAPPVIYGVLTILVVFIVPNGIVGALRRLVGIVRRGAADRGATTTA